MIIDKSNKEKFARNKLINDKSLDSLNRDLLTTSKTPRDEDQIASDEDYETELEEIYIAYTNQYIRDETGKYYKN